MRMIIRLLLSAFVLLLCTAATPKEAAQERTTINVAQHIGTPTNTAGGISEQRAIVIANKDARRRFSPLSRFRIIPCEQVRFWRIIYDGGGPEYVIDKLSARIIRRQKIPQ